MKRKMALLMAGLVLVTSMTGCTIGDTEYVLDMNEVGKDHIFSVNGEKCSKEEAWLYLCNYQNIYGQEYGVNLWEHDFGFVVSDSSLENYVRDVTLMELANITCMNLLAKEQGLSLTETEVKQAEAAAKEYFDSLSDAEKAYMGIEKSEVEGAYRKYAIAQKLFDTLTQGVNEEVSDDEARVIRIEQIYLSSDTKLAEVEKRLEKSEFATVASNYNEADSIEILVKRGELPREVEMVAFGLDNNEKSEAIATENGYYFVRCVNKYEAELTEQNKLDIIANRRKEQFDDLFAGFVNAAEFELNKELWEEKELDISGSITTDSFFEVYDKHFGRK